MADETPPENAEAPAEAPVEAPAETTEVSEDLQGIAPEDPWAEPTALGDGVESFDRKEVELLYKQASDYRTQARGYHDTLDGASTDDIKEARSLLKDLQTAEGATQVWLDTGTAIGLSLEQMESIVNSGQLVQPKQEAAPSTEVEDPSLDDVMTKREFQAAFAKEREVSEKSVEEQRQEQAVNTANDAVKNTFIALKVEDEDERRLIAALGDKHLKTGGIPSAADAEEALRHGYDDFQTLTEKKVTEYIEGKRKQKADAPKTLGTSAAGSEDTKPEPPARGIQEVIERRRAREKAAAGE